MIIESARRAGELAQMITAREEKAAAISTALSEGWRVKEMRAVRQDDGREISLIVSLLDAETSAQCFGFALQIYAGQLEALNAELAAL